jgi:hypothetical protein
VTSHRNLRARLFHNPPDPPDLINLLETVIEEERARLMAAEATLGCLQSALDPEAIKVQPDVYFPHVVGLARELVSESIRRLDYFRLRKLVHESIYGRKPY